MKPINISFKIETHEDFHIGTGMDNVGLFDDGQLKDENGFPLVRTETLKGLLKQSCLEIRNEFGKFEEKEYYDAFDQMFDFKNLV